MNASVDPEERYDVLVWLRDRPGTLQGGEWLVQHPEVTREQARAHAVEARNRGDRTRVQFVGTDEWAQEFEVWTEERTLEAVFACEGDALDYAILLRREQGCVGTCRVTEAWRTRPQAEVKAEA